MDANGDGVVKRAEMIKALRDVPEEAAVLFSDQIYFWNSGR